MEQSLTIISGFIIGGIVGVIVGFSIGAENVKAQATGTSLDADGFTVNVVAASGTQVIAYIAFG